MKWVVYLLLLVNISLFVWHYQGDDEQVDGHPQLTDEDRAALQLVLLKEAEQQSSSPEKLLQCPSLGPFDDKKQAALAEKLLQAESMDVKSVMRKDAKRKAYWVFLPPAESREAAMKNITRLKNKNISDYFLVVTGDQINAVSLGVYTQFESAHRRIKQMQDLGFTPRYDKVNLPKREYWIDWPPGSDVKLDESLMTRIRKIQQNVEIKNQECG